MKKKDRRVTDIVDFYLNDDEALPIIKCVCGAKFAPWDFFIGIDDGSDLSKCPKCGAKLYFTTSIDVYQRIE